MVVLFYLLFSMNLFGLVPYAFSLTRHLAFNLSLALPIWLRIVLMGLVYN